MKRLLLSLSLSAALSGAVACEPGASDAPVCDELAAVSVTVNVENDAGEPVDDAVVTFRVDDGIAQRCTFLADGAYQCGVELSGDFAITVTRTGFASQTATVTVEADECHVIGESVTVTLAPVPPGG